MYFRQMFSSRLLRLVVLVMTLTTAMSSSTLAIGDEFFIEFSPLYFFYQGGGGSIGKEHGHWQKGIAFNTFNPSDFKLGKNFDLSGNLSTLRTMSFEPFTKFYFSRHRKWFYLGLGLVPQVYAVDDSQTGARSYKINGYIKPKAGIRWFPFKKFLYIDLSYALSMNIVNSKWMAPSQSDFTWKDMVYSPEASVGFRF